MVLERLFPEAWLERKFSYAFLLGVSYSFLGILLAKLLFPSNSGIVSVIFISIFLSPSMRKIFAREEKSEERQKKFSLKKIYNLDYDVVYMYMLIFFGIFLSYLIFSFVMPQFGFSTFNLFKEQLFLDPALKGRATFSFGALINILYNNWWVLLATFMLALIAGDGAIFFVAWNASSWGAIFGTRALQAAIYTSQEPLLLLFELIIAVVWHVALEGGAYILAGIAGSTISHEIIKEKIEVKEFVVWLFASAFVFFGARYFLGSIGLSQIAKLLVYFILILAILYFLGKIVAERGNEQVYTFNLALFLIALLVFIAGAVLEVSIISNPTILTKINTLSFCFSQNIPFEQCARFIGA